MLSLLFNWKSIKGQWAYLIIISFFIFVFFIFPIGNDIFGDISRVFYLSLFSIFPAYIVMSKKKFSSVINTIVNFYFIIFSITLFDAAIYFIQGATILFPMIHYITPRFSGPFNDPNFMGFISGLMFIVVMGKRVMIKHRWAHILVFFSCMLLSGSFTGVILCLLSLFLVKLYRFNNLVMKPILCILFVFIITPSFVYNQDLLRTMFTDLINYFFVFDPFLIDVKFNSLLYRFESVNFAINYILVNPLGYGYLTLLDYLPRDTHNSYIGISFEYGIIMLALIVISLACKTRDENSDTLSTFTCMSALFLNIHYMPIYFFVVLFCFNFRDINEKRRI